MANDAQQNNLLVHLHKWAYRQDENFLTDAFAHLLRHLRDNEPDVARQVLCQLTGGRLNFTRLAIGNAAITTQVTTEQGRPDIEIQTTDCLVYVEAKKESGLGDGQLSRYRQELDKRTSDHKCLVLLTRYPVTLPPSEEQPDVFCRWYEVAAWLERECTNGSIKEQTSVYLVTQFIGFLKVKGITMDKAGWELVAGVRSLRAILTMLEEAITAQKRQPCRTHGWGWMGYYLDEKAFYVGVHFDRPGVVSFMTWGMRLAQDAAKKAGFGKVVPDSTSPTGILWWYELDLESEEVHFFALPREKQMQCIEEFLRTSLNVARTLKADITP